MGAELSAVPDGPGVEGNFLGLDAPHSAFEHAKFCVIPAPFGLTTSYGKGTEIGPKGLIEASRYVELYDSELDNEPYRVGIHTMDPVSADNSESMLAQLQKRVSSVLSANKIPVMIGGEHSLTAAPVRALAEKYDSFSVLQFDAHADLRSAYEGNPNSHASVMARVKEVSQVSNVVAVGLRAIDREEREAGVREDMFFDHELSGNLVERVLARLPEKRLYISFDVDAFGPELMPSTGTPEPGGIGWWQALNLLRAVSAKKEIIGCDVVELAPIQGFPAPDFVAARLVYKMIAYASLGIA